MVDNTWNILEKSEEYFARKEGAWFKKRGFTFLFL
jgi:hypothetical protein